MAITTDKELTLEELKRQVALGEKENDNSGERTQLIVFKLSDEEYALPIDQIKEVVLTPSVAKVPQTPPYIKGVANIRGNLIAIVDLEEKFGLSNKTMKEAKQSNYTLVIESEDFKIGVLVKEVPNTLNVKVKDIDESSSIMQYSSLDENAMKGIVKVEDRMIIMIDMFSMMQSEEVKNLTKI